LTTLAARRRLRRRWPVARAGRWPGALLPLGWSLWLLGGVLAPLTGNARQRVVDPGHPAARDAGDGAAAAPWRTLDYAMRHLAPGDQLEIAAGVYREALRFPERNDWADHGPTVIRGRGRVVLMASDVVAHWQPAGAGRHSRPWPTEPAQVWLDGAALTQIGGSLFGGPARADIWPGRRAGDQDSMPDRSFYYDAKARLLVLRVSELPSLAGHTVEVAVRPFLMRGRGLARVEVHDLEFRHGNASPFARGGLIQMVGQQLWLDRLRIIAADAVGLELVGDANRLTNSVMLFCGQAGLVARGRHVRIEGNETSYNNTRGFNKWWEAGGAKFVGAGGLRESLVDRHVAIGNQGDGIWFDWNNQFNRVTRGIFAGNRGMGIQYEASSGAWIENNLVVGNRQRGIYLPHSSDSTVIRNLIAGNGLQGVAIVDEGRGDPAGAFDMTPRNNQVRANLLAWNGGAVVLPQVLDGNRSDANQILGAGAQVLFQAGWQGTAVPLARWQGASGQDVRSTVVPLTRPATLGAEATWLQFLQWFAAWPERGQTPLGPQWPDALGKPAPQ